MTKSKRTCSVSMCDRKHYGRGLCRFHWDRQHRTGNALWQPTQIRGDDDARIESKIDRLSGAPCWLWRGKARTDGYCRLPIEGKNKYAHIVVWERVNGSVPVGLTLDHECHNEAAVRGECAGGRECLHRRCVNPQHLVPKPMGENTLASPMTPTSINRMKTRCKRGHEFIPENVYLGKDGSRRCRPCALERERLRYAAKKESA